MTSKFNFESQREQSAIKTDIVTKYFDAWSKIMKIRSSNNRIAYIDLFSGPGIYEDGTESTPIHILKHIINDPTLRKITVTFFNEKDPDLYFKLKSNITSLSGIKELTYPPQINNESIDYNTPESFNFNLVPCFSFIDPSGYVGLSLNLIKSLSKDFGSDIIFFFNYNDINRGLSNPSVENHMIELFGKQRCQYIKRTLHTISDPHTRELFIVNQMSEAIKDIEVPYVIPFRFQKTSENRTSHYIIFATKHILGYTIMKDIMYKAGEKDSNGIGRYEYIPTQDRQKNIQLSILDFFNTPLDQLKNDLCSKYAGQELFVGKLIRLDIPYTKFVSKQYKTVLKELEKEGRITCIPPQSERRSNTLGDRTLIIF